MNFSGPLPVALPPPVDTHGLSQASAKAWSVNQRIVAEVLAVAGDRVLLAVDGVRMVARLTTLDQAAALENQRQAQFIVKDAASDIIQVQLLGGEGEAGAAAPAPELIPNLLRQVGLPVTPLNLEIARALLNHNLPVTPQLVEEFSLVIGKLIEQLPGSGASASTQVGVQAPQLLAPGSSGLLSPGSLNLAQIAGAAATLKADGLPLSPGTLLLVLTSLPSPGLAVGRVRTALGELLQLPIPQEMAEKARSALAALSGLGIDPGSAPAEIAGQVRQAAALLGRSLESEVAGLLRQGSDKLDTLADRSAATVLARLKLNLAQMETSPRLPGIAHLSEQIDQALESLRQAQFINTAPELQAAQGDWLQLTLPVNLPLLVKNGQMQSGVTDARLRIAYEREGGKRKIDPAYTRLMIQVELAPGETLGVDLSVFERQVGANVVSSTADLDAIARGELSALEHGLAELGYHLQTARFDVNAQVLNLGEDLSTSAAHQKFTELDLEV